MSDWAEASTMSMLGPVMCRATVIDPLAQLQIFRGCRTWALHP